MDKRYFLILIIIIICCINLSIIVNNSDTVGSASTSIGKYLFSVPEGFSLYENNGNSAVIQNENNTTIYVKADVSDSDNYLKRLDYIENDTTDIIISKGSFSIDNISVDAVYYQSTSKVNKSTFYFEKDNTPFKISMSGFNYNNDRNLTLDYVTHIIQSTHLNYKSK